MNEQEIKELHNKGLLALEKKNYDYAIEIFSQILSLQFDDIEIRKLLHLSYRNKHAESKKSPISNITNSINTLVVSAQADALIKKSNISGALEKLENIMAKNPDNLIVLKKIADIFYKQGSLNNAIQNLEETKSINPKDTDTLKKLGDIYSKKEDYAKAKLNYESALQINPNDTDTLKSLKNLEALGTIQRDFGN